MIFRKKTNNDTNFNHPHIGDVVRIQRVAEEHGYEADLEACAYIWDEYSDRHAAGWINLPEDDEYLWPQVLSTANSLNHIKGFEV